MHIVFAADQAFVRPLLVASGSAVYACRGGNEPITVHVLDCGIEEATWNDYASRITCLAERVHVKTDLVRHVIDMKQFEGLPGWRGSKATWARLLIPDLLPNVDQCVYSDCDMLFIANPVEMLNALKDLSVLIAGHHEPFCGAQYPDSDWCHARSLPFDASTHLCSGLLAMNLRGLRCENIILNCLDFAMRYRDPPFPDQTTLNCICFGRKAFLPDGWGLFPRECSASDVCIKAVHIAGGCGWPFPKPSCLHHVMWLRLSRCVFKLWWNFEKRVLGFRPVVRVTPALRLRILSEVAIFAARLTNLFGIRIGHARVQRFVAAYSGRSTSLATARQALFGDIDRWK